MLLRAALTTTARSARRTAYAQFTRKRAARYHLPASNAQPLSAQWRAFSSKRPADGEAGGEQVSISRKVLEEQDYAPMLTTAQKVKEGTKTVAILGALGLGVTCAGLVFWNMRPTKYAPKQIFDKALAAVIENPEVTMRIGTGIVGYGTDYNSRAEGRRNFVASDDFTDDFGNRVVRIKFNVKGERGKGTVYAAVSSAVQSDLLYLIFEHGRPGKGSVAIPLVDNRRQLTTEDEQMRIAKMINDLGGELYGSEDDPHTQRQKMELGDYFGNIKYVQCEKHGLEASKAAHCEKLKSKFPSWKFGERSYAGVRPRDNLNEICKYEFAKQAKDAGKTHKKVGV